MQLWQQSQAGPSRTNKKRKPLACLIGLRRLLDGWAKQAVALGTMFVVQAGEGMHEKEMGGGSEGTHRAMTSETLQACQACQAAARAPPSALFVADIASWSVGVERINALRVFLRPVSRRDSPWG